jgi:hypothetical protein
VGFGRVISRGGPNLVLTRVVTALNGSPPICDSYRNTLGMVVKGMEDRVLCDERSEGKGE